MVDANFINTLYLTVGINIASNGLTSLFAHTGREIKGLLSKKESDKQSEETALQALFEYALDDLDKRTSLTPSKGREILSSFLHSSEVEEIVRQIYSINLVDHKENNYLETIRNLFVKLLTRYFAAYPSDVTLTKRQLLAIADPLFNALIKGCEATLDAAIEKEGLAAYEAKGIFRFNILQSQLAAIRKELEFLPKINKLDINAILAFEKQYRERVGQRHGRIIPPNMNSAQPHPIDALYVYPTFSQVKNETKSEISKDKLFSSSFRSVVLGNPGGGKSTLALKLCHELAKDYSERIFAGRRGLTPILVILRNYGAEKKERKCSILEFIEAEVKSTYQLQASPYNAFQYLLHTGRAMVIFDGLDELLDTTYRQEIRDDVELFCASYPSVPVLVTSREIGYEQAPLDKNIFQVFHLDHFSDSQVEEYVSKWFHVADIDGTEKQRKAMAAAFIKESKLVADLRSNPLMLALLCTIYREEHYIPRYRPDVYEKCAIVLFERWDKNRDIYHPPLPEEHIRQLMEYLAQWIYGNEQLRAGVTEDELAGKTAAYLHEWIYENIYKAERIAQEFIRFCVGRAWVFTDTGTKKEGERLYQFAHTTFLEYFAASYYVRSCRTPKELLQILKPKIAKEEWDVVAQLAFQLQHKKNVGAGDELLKNLVDESRKNAGGKGWNILSFSARCLQFIVPRPDIRRLIVEAFLEKSIALTSETSQNKNKQQASDVLDILADVADENQTTVINTLTNSITAFLKDINEKKITIALEILARLEWRNTKAGLVIVDNVMNKCANLLEELYSKRFLFGFYALWAGRISISDFFKFYGIEGLSHSNSFRTMTISTFGVPLIQVLTLYTLAGPGLLVELLDTNAPKLLRDLGRILPSYSAPWFSCYNIYSAPVMNITPITNDTDNNLLFGIFITIAWLIELAQVASNQVTQIQRVDSIKILNTKKEFDKKIQNLSAKEEYEFYTLFSKYPCDLIEDRLLMILQKYKLTREQQTIIESWLQEKIHLIDIRKVNDETI